MSIYKLIPYSTLNKNNFFFLPSTACTHPMKNYTDIQRDFLVLEELVLEHSVLHCPPFKVFSLNGNQIQKSKRQQAGSCFCGMTQ